jgi:hypothetical protein
MHILMNMQRPPEGSNLSLFKTTYRQCKNLEMDLTVLNSCINMSFCSSKIDHRECCLALVQNFF